MHTLHYNLHFLLKCTNTNTNIDTNTNTTMNTNTNKDTSTNANTNTSFTWREVGKKTSFYVLPPARLQTSLLNVPEIIYM